MIELVYIMDIVGQNQISTHKNPLVPHLESVIKICVSHLNLQRYICTWILYGEDHKSFYLEKRGPLTLTHPRRSNITLLSLYIKKTSFERVSPKQVD